MLGRFPKPAFMPCPECGASVARGEQEKHVCERERWLDYQLFVQRAKVARFDEDLAAYYDSPEGRFKVWDAKRTRDAEDPDRPADEGTESGS
jgi:endogenous inhibitor of DNA gyrase (YacG/DUF329 family)